MDICYENELEYNQDNGISIILTRQGI